ncbi:MAG: ATP-binding protein [Streptosporangiales bacterium]
MAAVELSIPAGAEHVRIVRLVAVATARVAGVPEDTLDDLRLAVDEASSRAVRLNAKEAQDVPVKIVMDVVDGVFSVTVSDAAPPQPEPPAEPRLLTALDVDALPIDSDTARASTNGGGVEHAAVIDTVLPDDFGLALVRGLVDDVQLTRGDTGWDIRLTWPLAAGGRGPRPGAEA